MFAYCSRVRDEFKSEKGWRRGRRVKNEKGWRRSQGMRTKANNSAIERERANFPVYDAMPSVLMRHETPDSGSFGSYRVVRHSASQPPQTPAIV